MPQVRVWNDNEYPFEQEFKDNMIRIPPHKFIMMDYGDAILFRGTYFPMMKDAMDNPDPKFFKMIRIDIPEQEQVNVEPKIADIDLTCQACGYKGLSKWDLKGHIEELHKDLWVKDEQAEKAAEEAKKAKAAKGAQKNVQKNVRSSGSK